MTVESAIGLSTLLLVTVACLAGIACATAQVRCLDAAREGARLAARGADASTVSAIAPSGAVIDVQAGGGRVVVVVTASPLGGILPGIRLSATATAATEPGRTG